MKNIGFILLFFMFVGFVDQANAVDIEQRRKQIISIIDEELNEVSQLNRRNKGRDPDLLLRMAELNLEKARLYRESENKQFLAITAKSRAKISKKKYFAKSNRYFDQARNLCSQITRKFKRYRRLSEVYYILGFRAKENNNLKQATKYLKLANKGAKSKNSKVKTQISLAEVYYNQKNYRRAIPLYESALRKGKDKWWTKDSFNLAWCYFRVQNYSKAISTMSSVYSASASSKYVDMRSQVERDIGFFYATSGKIQEGIRFYKKLGINFTERLIRIALALIEEGKATQAATVLNHAEKYEKEPRKLSKILIEKLVLFQKFSNYRQHNITARKLFNIYKAKKLDRDQENILKFQLAKVGAMVQKRAISKTYRKVRSKRVELSNQAISYFNMLAVMDARKREEYKYLQAETAFAAGFSTAFALYKDTFQYSEKLPNPRFKRKAMEGMLTVLGSQKRQNFNNNVYVFESFIKHWPKGRKSKDIYKRLFNNYKDKKQYDKAKSVLDRFVKNYPRDNTQEVMIATLMDVSRKKKDNARIRVWINDIDAGIYFVSAKYKRKLQELLTTIQIEDVQAELGKGNKKVALVGYHDILNDKHSTKRSKINAKYNLSALYYELGDVDNAYKWSVSAINEMGTKDVVNFSASFITIANFLFTSLEFNKSASLSSLLIDKTCKRKFKRKQTAFKNAAFIHLADGNINATEALVRKGRNCRIKSSLIQQIEFEIARELKKQKKWVRYEHYVMKLKNTKQYSAKMIDDLIDLAGLHRNFNNLDKVKRFEGEIWKQYFKAKKSKAALSMKTLDFISETYLNKMKITARRIELIKYQFPPQKVQKRYKQKTDLLTKFTNQAQEVQQVGSGVGIVNSYKLLSETYMKAANEIFNFMPKNDPKKIGKLFKKDFNPAGEQLKSAALTYKREALKAIKNNSILNQNNFFFQENPVPVKYFGVGSAVLMDRGGKQ